MHERPNFIDLDSLAGQIDEHMILIPSGGFSSIDYELANGLLARARQPGPGANGISLTKQVEDFGALVFG